MRSYSIYLFPLAVLFCAGGLGAQSFLKKYPHPLSSAPNVQSVFVYPNGDIGLGMFDAFNNRRSLLRTDADGQLLSFSEQLMPDNHAHFTEADGVFVTAFGSADSLILWKRNPDGSTVWRQAVLLSQTPGVQIAPVQTLTENEAGEIFVRGAITLNLQIVHYYTAKFSPGGSLQWANPVVTSAYESYTGMNPDPAGGVLSYWRMNNAPTSQLWHYQADGTTAWTFQSEGLMSENSYQLGFGANTAGQSLVITTNDEDWPADFHNWTLLGPAGDTLWAMSTLGNSALDHLTPHVVLPTADSGFVVFGSYEDHPHNKYTGTVAKINIAGLVQWVQPFTPLITPITSQLAYFNAGRVLADGSILAAGEASDVNFLVKIPPGGSFTGFQNTVTGMVAVDEDADCTLDPAEPPLAGWTVTALGDDFQAYGFTDNAGHYHIPYLDTGFYQIVLTAPNGFWQVCPDTAIVYFPASVSPLTDTVDFSPHNPYACPTLEVQLTAPNLRACFSRPLFAKVCNYGLTTADPMQLYLTLDPLLSVVQANHPFTVSGDTVFFEPDVLQPFECRTYEMNVLTSCDALLGQTLCLKAHATPDTICGSIQNWSGASIVVDGACEGDSVRFRIRNAGGAPTSQDLDFVIIDDHVITKMGQFNLPAGETHEETVEATGSTWRLTADQEPGYPFSQQPASVAVEACSADGQFSTGMVNLFANYSGSPFEDIECREVTGSYDPNDKTGWPLGPYSNCIEARQELDYMVRFQNTGTDTAFYVEIQDTLSPWLDPATVRAVSASHPFHWSLSGPGVLRMVFDGIALPDSNANEPASHGFVRFQIAQRPGNPVGAMLENRAGIYFDNNPVVLTNTTFHMVCPDFVQESSGIIFRTQEELSANTLRIFPNPAAQALTVQIQAEQFGSGQIRLTDLFGRVIWQQNVVVPTTTTIPRNGLVNGLYFIELEGKDGLRMAGRVIFE